MSLGLTPETMRRIRRTGCVRRVVLPPHILRRLQWSLCADRLTEPQIAKQVLGICVERCFRQPSKFSGLQKYFVEQ